MCYKVFHKWVHKVNIAFTKLLQLFTTSQLSTSLLLQLCPKVNARFKHLHISPCFVVVHVSCPWDPIRCKAPYACHWTPPFKTLIISMVYSLIIVSHQGSQHDQVLYEIGPTSAWRTWGWCHQTCICVMAMCRKSQWALQLLHRFRNAKHASAAWLFAGRLKELNKESCAQQMKAVVSLFYTMHCQGSFN